MKIEKDKDSSTKPKQENKEQYNTNTQYSNNSNSNTPTTDTAIIDLPNTSPEKRKNGFSHIKKSAFIQAYRQNRASPNIACQRVGISFETYWRYANPESEWFDHGFNAQLVAIQKAFGHKIENIVFKMAEVEKTSHFNHQIAVLRALLPNRYDRAHVQIAIGTNGDINMSYAKGNQTLRSEGVGFFGDKRGNAIANDLHNAPKVPVKGSGLNNNSKYVPHPESKEKRALRMAHARKIKSEHKARSVKGTDLT